MISQDILNCKNVISIFIVDNKFQQKKPRRTPLSERRRRGNLFRLRYHFGQVNVLVAPVSSIL